MFQEICQLKFGWDEALPVKFVSDWKESTEDMKRVSSIAIPRYILGGIEAEEVTSIQLHGFADARKTAYGANVYIRVSTTGLQNPSCPSERRHGPSSRADGSLNTSKLDDSSV